MGESNNTVRLYCGDRPSVHDGGPADRVVSVLFDTDVEAWRSAWGRTAAGPPTREAVVDVNDIVRSGATASTQVMPNSGLAHTVLGRATECERVFDAVAEHVEGAPPGTVDVFVDDLAAVAARNGVDSAVAFAERLVERFRGRASRITIGCSFEGPAELLSRVVADVDAVVGVDPSAASAVERLSRDDPTTFGYVRRHWAEAKRGIEACDRNYPQSKQVHAALTDPETTPRTLGATLSGLVTLGALETWGDTVGSTRYDLTAYRPERTWAVGVALVAGVPDE